MTGAVFVHKDSTASFGGEIVFANNTAEKNGGTKEVKCTLDCCMSGKKHKSRGSVERAQS